MEIQMVRSSAYARPPDDEEIGMTLKDIEEGFVLEIVRDGELIVDPDEPIEEDDDLIYMPSGVSDTYGDLFWTNEMAKRLDVNLSIHTPFYMDLGSNNDLTENCMDSIRHAALILNALGGDVVVTSLGVYDDKTDREEIDENILNNVADIMDWWQGNGLTPRLGVEVTGQEDVFGSLDQILDLCDQIPGVIPVLNFSHLHSRTNGSLLDVDDFLNVLEQVESYSDGRIHTAFAGVEYSEGNEKRLTPIKKGDLRFEPLAEALIEMKPNATVISTSPLLEHDAMYMKIILERVLAKKVAKDMKERKKAEMAAASE
jgi:deoxyribonuclease-4